MLTLRLYTTLLISIFLAVSLNEHGIGLLEGTVVTCSLLFLIFDMRKDMVDLKRLETQIASIHGD
jgi:hypothetical protein